LAAPETAVVTAFERVDIAELDVMGEIVGGVDPDRALADHAFGHRLQLRAGSQVLIGAGPLIVGPDIAAGVPSSPATRAGRALALQLLAVTLARNDGLPAARIICGALPGWLAGEPGWAALAAAEVELRRALYVDHPLAFDDAAVEPSRRLSWPFVMTGVAAPGAETALVMRRRAGPDSASLAKVTRAAAGVGVEIAAARSTRPLEGLAAAHAREAVTAAEVTLEQLGVRGWRAVLGDTAGPDGPRLGANAVVERSDGFDPLESV
jgi:hypothetical protein